ncbi:hypothetical protein ACVW0J_000457 [Bradyrhizobium sp. i1.7.7]
MIDDRGARNGRVVQRQRGAALDRHRADAERGGVVDLAGAGDVDRAGAPDGAAADRGIVQRQCGTAVDDDVAARIVDGRALLDRERAVGEHFDDAGIGDGLIAERIARTAHLEDGIVFQNAAAQDGIAGQINLTVVGNRAGAANAGVEDGASLVITATGVDHRTSSSDGRIADDQLAAGVDRDLAGIGNAGALMDRQPAVGQHLDHTGRGVGHGLVGELDRALDVDCAGIVQRAVLDQAGAVELQRAQNADGCRHRPSRCRRSASSRHRPSASRWRCGSWRASSACRRTARSCRNW